MKDLYVSRSHTLCASQAQGTNADIATSNWTRGLQYLILLSSTKVVDYVHVYSSRRGKRWVGPVSPYKLIVTHVLELPGLCAFLTVGVIINDRARDDEKGIKVIVCRMRILIARALTETDQRSSQICTLRKSWSATYGI